VGEIYFLNFEFVNLALYKQSRYRSQNRIRLNFPFPEPHKKMRLRNSVLNDTDFYELENCVRNIYSVYQKHVQGIPMALEKKIWVIN
jgi:hypothetical protein